MHQRYTIVGFFYQESSPSAIFNIEEHDTAAIIFPIKNADKVLLNEGVKLLIVVIVRLCHIKTATICGYSSLKLNLYFIFDIIRIGQMKQT